MSAEELVYFNNQHPELIPVRSIHDSSLYSNCELDKNVDYEWYMIVREDGVQQLIREAARVFSYKRLGMFLGSL
jgi:hypothetical protein